MELKKQKKKVFENIAKIFHLKEAFSEMSMLLIKYCVYYLVGLVVWMELCLAILSFLTYGLMYDL